jgi:hypothetical protein
VRDAIEEYSKIGGYINQVILSMNFAEITDTNLDPELQQKCCASITKTGYLLLVSKIITVVRIIRISVETCIFFKF